MLNNQDLTPSGVYSNSEILAAIKSGQVIFHPFNKQQITGSSIDVTLGNFYYRTEYDTQSDFYNPFDENDVSNYFAGPFKAQPHQAWALQSKRQLFKNIPKDHPIIVLKPGERILAHTHEFIGILPPGTSTMQARSTWGRNGVAVCLDAGWGDPGYINRWTMEVYNLNQHHHMVLPVGERIAQIVFHHTGPVIGRYDIISGKYQASHQLNQLIKNWQPDLMLPKAYKDKRVLPKKMDIKNAN